MVVVLITARGATVGSIATKRSRIKDINGMIDVKPDEIRPNKYSGGEIRSKFDSKYAVVMWCGRRATRGKKEGNDDHRRSRSATKLYTPSLVSPDRFHKDLV